MGLIYDIRHYSIHDGPGIRTTVFFKGCPLRCWWCHNPESQEMASEVILKERILDGRSFVSRSTVGRRQSAGKVMEEIYKDEVFYMESGGGVTFSGGEPLMQTDFLVELLKLCRERGYHTAVDTSGYAEPGSLGKVMKHTSMFLYDIKLVDDARHVEYTGVSNALSLDNLKLLAKSGKEVIIRFPVVPGYTDGQENLQAIGELMAGLGLRRIDVLPYHAIARHKYENLGKEFLMNEVKEPGYEEIEGIRLFFENEGLAASVGG